jgi:membrane protease YdiL (CAAX protease family)
MHNSLLINPPNTNSSPATFFALTFLLSVPFYILNALAYLNIVGEPELGAVYIALFTVTPITAASILSLQRGRVSSLKALLRRVFDSKRITKSQWYAAIFLLAPLIFLVSLGGLMLAGLPIPPALAPLVAFPAVFPLFFLLAAGEEVGWMGYAFEPMQTRGNALSAALVLGAIWALWHVPFFVFMIPNPVDFSTQVLTLIGTRVIVAWIFNNTGKSVFATILFHAADNTALVTLPEIHANTPWGGVLHCGVILFVVTGVTFLWGPRTLARYRFVS